ncbi:hypothetical protein P153DRAFT_435625 [Dothidotthia symphoricarpi CBS 119687]|uniref:Uncharacterized protein n=1 Tax=Dothidotthia symphoricarpi CBS 119687 TaxID=1392245 RepID=A0A6A5ZZ36_9PLEO|nr:uncharacterized protein P153DRAFT_435625 [Dothidotthia symphoricarpi CBS 119687]KAF2124017.1 hypothetical protein P153DRAFT_435625 [Dothidotthia symphoricarpi CBS 119687]
MLSPHEDEQVALIAATRSAAQALQAAIWSQAWRRWRSWTVGSQQPGLRQGLSPPRYPHSVISTEDGDRIVQARTAHEASFKSHSGEAGGNLELRPDSMRHKEISARWQAPHEVFTFGRPGPHPETESPNDRNNNEKRKDEQQVVSCILGEKETARQGYERARCITRPGSGERVQQYRENQLATATYTGGVCYGGRAYNTISCTQAWSCFGVWPSRSSANSEETCRVGMQHSPMT